MTGRSFEQWKSARDGDITVSTLTDVLMFILEEAGGFVDI